MITWEAKGYSGFQVFSKIKRGVKGKKFSCNSNILNITITRGFFHFSKPMKTTEYLNTRIPLRPFPMVRKMPQNNRLRDFLQSSVCFVKSPFRCSFLAKYIPKYLTTRFWGCIFAVLLLTTDFSLRSRNFTDFYSLSPALACWAIVILSAAKDLSAYTKIPLAHTKSPLWRG